MSSTFLSLGLLKYLWLQLTFIWPLLPSSEIRVAPYTWRHHSELFCVGKIMCGLDLKSFVSQKKCSACDIEVIYMYPTPISKAWVCSFVLFARFCWSNLIIYSFLIADSLKRRAWYKWCPEFALPGIQIICLHHPSSYFSYYSFFHLGQRVQTLKLDLDLNPRYTI